MRINSTMVRNGGETAGDGTSIVIEADWPMTHSLQCSGPVKSFALDFQITLRFTSKLKQTASGWPEAE